MKTKLFSLFLMLTLSIGTIFASNTQVDGIWYNFDSNNLTAEVTFRGTSSSQYSNEYSGAVIIPDSVIYNNKTYSVTSIAGGAFGDCSRLTSVTIPNSVTSIGNSAFFGCTGLTSPVYNAHVFAYLPYRYSGAFTISNGIESIAGGAFGACSRLTSVTIPSSVISIGEGAFYGCTDLTYISIPNSVTSIGDYTFYNCRKITSITFPNSVTTIGSYVFFGCIGLTSVTIGDGVTSIGSSAFSGCTGLNSIFIPNSVTSIGDSALFNCSGLTSVTIPKSVTSIGSRAFHSCTGLTSISIGNSVTSIGYWAFRDCTNLTYIKIEAETPPTLGKDVFYNTNLFHIHVPCGTLNAYRSASGWSIFANLIQYKPLGYKITIIPSEFGHVATPVFECDLPLVATPNYGCHFVRWSDGNTDNPRTIVLTQDTTFTAEFAPNPRITYLYDSVQGVVMGDTITPTGKAVDTITFEAISNYGYHFTNWSDGNMDNPRTIILTQDTTFTAIFAIDKGGVCGANNELEWAYDDNSKTLTITGNGALTSNYTFGVEAPTQMQNLIIGNDVTAIGDRAFYAKNTLNHLTIGGNVASIGDYAFAECKNFDDITCYATTVPTISDKTFNNVGNKQYIYLFVPEDRERAYKRDVNWGEFDIQIQGAETATTDGNVKITPTDNTVEITWPSVDSAETYEIVITKDGEVVCTLIFNANGQLAGIAFAPGRNGANHTQQAQTAGFKFTVTGLNSGTNYGYLIDSKDDNGSIIDSKTGTFTTTVEGESVNPEGLEEVSSSLQGGDRGRLIFHNGQIFILRGDKTYTLTGQEVK